MFTDNDRRFLRFLKIADDGVWPETATERAASEAFINGRGGPAPIGLLNWKPDHQFSVGPRPVATIPPAQRLIAWQISHQATPETVAAVHDGTTARLTCRHCGGGHAVSLDVLAAVWPELLVS